MRSRAPRVKQIATAGYTVCRPDVVNYLTFGRQLRSEALRRIPRASGGREIPALAPAVDDHLHGYRPQRARQQRRDRALAEMPPDAESVGEQQIGVETRATGVDPPAAIDRDLASVDARPLGARPVAVGKRR